MKKAKMGTEAEGKIVGIEKKHYVLVHGACHGAWCWYKVKPRLESAGHRVTVLDLAASGINATNIQDLETMSDYSKPLFNFLASLPPNHKVVLVGHSLGGLNLALATDLFPHKIALSVFLTAFMPDTSHAPSYVIQQYIERTPAENWLDTQFNDNGKISVMLFGPKFLSSKLYQLCSIEDVELAKALIRPSSLFVEDLSKANNFSKEGYGSVPRAYIVCKKDLGIPEKFQVWMIQNFGINEIFEIEDADHMPMLSTPQQLSDALLNIASKYD
ncbi:salicylic acid-binding protein 2-like [Senna tora]|uniref:(S)-hydroxynitrile lyase n=1 Tax=Senna tora TaxID=362788 RepID=A0A834TY04_9FABA|nr:salicylic acid-binding protein 2-like [Senna tora]